LNNKTDASVCHLAWEGVNLQVFLPPAHNWPT